MKKLVLAIGLGLIAASERDKLAEPIGHVASWATWAWQTGILTDSAAAAWNAFQIVQESLHKIGDLTGINPMLLGGVLLLAGSLFGKRAVGGSLSLAAGLTKRAFRREPPRELVQEVVQRLQDASVRNISKWNLCIDDWTLDSKDGKVRVRAVVKKYGAELYINPGKEYNCMVSLSPREARLLFVEARRVIDIIKSRTQADNDAKLLAILQG